MGYDDGMDVRKATPAAAADSTAPYAGDWVEAPLTAADIAACEEAEAQIARGEWIDGDTMMAKLDAMIRRHQARAAKQN